jgi:hypothetical protein
MVAGQEGREPVQRDDLHRADPHGDGRRAGAADRGAERIEGGQHRLEMRDEAMALRRQRDAAPGPGEQALAERRLQLVDAGGNRGLAHMEPRCRLAETAGPGRDEEGPDDAAVHRPCIGWR